MKNSIEQWRLLLIALLISLLVSSPKAFLINVGTAARGSSGLDFGIQLFFAFCFATLILFINTYRNDGFWQKIGLLTLIYVGCTVLFVQIHWQLSGITENIRFFRMGYYFRNLVILFTAVLVSNFLKTLFLKQILSHRNQHLENEKLKAELNNLKQQLNPHFLFNSLNSLNSLMREDVAKSHVFLENLSILLRFSLDNQKKDLILLEEELRVLNAYIYLVKIRFGDRLTILLKNMECSDIPNPFGTEGVKGKVPPMALQLLIENAVNHNEISSKKHLEIRLDIAENKEAITISNNINPKHSPSEGTGMGLYNLNTRYVLLANKEIDIIDTDGIFKVTIPIIK
jgi:two-component system, LytTR family, sensor kinase